MAKEKELTSQERMDFAFSKVSGACKWIMISGTATILFSQLLSGLASIEMPAWLSVVITAVLDAVIFGIAKYQEGQD